MCLDEGALSIHGGRPGVGQDRLGMFIESFDAAREEVTGIKVVSRGPFEEFPPACSKTK